MKKIKFLVLACTIMIGMNSCEKEGCTDENAINYNEDANKNDNSCNFVADEFVGTYKWTSPNGNETHICNIIKTSYNSLNIVNLTGEGKTFTGSVNNNTITFDKYDNFYTGTNSSNTNITYSANVISGTGTLSSTTLTIGFTVENKTFTNNVLTETETNSVVQTLVKQ